MLRITLLYSLFSMFQPILVADWIWWEGESASRHSFPDRPAFAPTSEAEAAKLSAGAWLQTDLGGGKGAYWEIQAKQAGSYEIWTRKFWKHGPFQWRFNQQDWRHCGRDCALADAVELRKHVVATWVYLGKAALVKGKNRFEIKVDQSATAVAFDCFIASRKPFQARGKLKPDEGYSTTGVPGGWTVFNPPRDSFDHRAAFDLRKLNQQRAGQEGFVIRLDDQLGFSRSRRPVRFWGVNLEVEFDNQQAADHIARHLAKRGVNLVRLHAPIGPEVIQGDPAVREKTLARIHYWVHTLARQGIYTSLSFYFPLWHKIPASNDLPGYEQVGDPRPFGLLFFHPEFQRHYRHWLSQLLKSENPHTGRPLAADPALAIVELCNEDNLFFWTFKPRETLPAESIEPLERAFGSWLKQRYGSLERAAARWGRQVNPLPGDDLPRGRVGLYAAGFLTNEPWARAGRNTPRAADQVRFMHDTQADFHKETLSYLRKEIGLRCAVVAGNWVTADDSVLAAIDKHSQFSADLLDRHYYASGPHQGPDSAFALRRGQLFADRSLLFEPEALATNEIQYNGFPTLVSEYGAPAPNRFRAESPLLAATYGSLLDTDGFVHFAHPGSPWQSSPTKFGLALPSLLGQFPACAIIYRQGLLQTARPSYQVEEAMDNLFDLNGSPVTRPAGLDTLRQAEGKQSSKRESGFDPLSFLVGPVEVNLTRQRESRAIRDFGQGRIDRQKGVVTSASGQLELDYQRGLLRIDAPAAQGFCGFPRQRMSTSHLTLSGADGYLSLLAVALDKQALDRSRRILIQVATEEKASGWRIAPGNDKLKSIEAKGGPPLLMRNPRGKLLLRHTRAGAMAVTTLDINGMPKAQLNETETGPSTLGFPLKPGVLYYLISPKQKP